MLILLFYLQCANKVLFQSDIRVATSHQLRIVPNVGASLPIISAEILSIMAAKHARKKLGTIAILNSDLAQMFVVK